MLIKTIIVLLVVIFVVASDTIDSKEKKNNDERQDKKTLNIKRYQVITINKKHRIFDLAHAPDAFDYGKGKTRYIYVESDEDISNEQGGRNKYKPSGPRRWSQEDLSDKSIYIKSPRLKAGKFNKHKNEAEDKPKNKNENKDKNPRNEYDGKPRNEYDDKPRHQKENEDKKSRIEYNDKLRNHNQKPADNEAKKIRNEYTAKPGNQKRKEIELKIPRDDLKRGSNERPPQPDTECWCDTGKPYSGGQKIRYQNRNYEPIEYERPPSYKSEMYTNWKAY